MFNKKSKVRLKNKPRRRTMNPGKRMLIRQFLIGFLVLLFVASLIAGLWYGTRLEQLTIKNIIVIGGQTISHEIVKEKAEAVLGGSYIGLIPRRFVWWYPHEDILEAVKSIPRIKNPVVERVSGTEIKIQFEEYFPYALWCDEIKIDECIFIEDTGYGFSVAPKLSGDTLLRYHSLGLKPLVGTSLLDKTKLTETVRFVNLVQTVQGFEVSTIEVDSMEDVFYILNDGGEIKANLSIPAEIVFANLQSILEAKEFTHLKSGAFQYIDLRFGNKVYVNDSIPVVSTSTATSTSTSETDSGAGEVIQ